MLTDAYNQLSCRGLGSVHLSQQSIRWWATGTSFRSKQLDEYDTPVVIVRLPCDRQGRWCHHG